MTKPAYDIIDFTLNQKPESVATTFADMANQAIKDRLEAKREEVAQAMFNDKESDPNDTDNDAEELNLADMSDEELESFLETLSPEDLEALDKELDAENE